MLKHHHVLTSWGSFRSQVQGRPGFSGLRGLSALGLNSCGALEKRSLRLAGFRIQVGSSVLCGLKFGVCLTLKFGALLDCRRFLDVYMGCIGLKLGWSLDAGGWYFICTVAD